jgi:aminopeptidase YwaD
MITDTADLRNPHYHRASDTAETLDYEFLGRATRAVVEVVEVMGNG